MIHNNKNTSLYTSCFSDAKFLCKVFYMWLIILEICVIIMALLWGGDYIGPFFCFKLSR